MLAGAAGSIVLSPTVVGVMTPIAARLEERFRSSDEDEELMTLNPTEALRGHIVICGYGRVGKVIGDALLRRGLKVVIIEQNSEIVRELRNRNQLAVLGYADLPAVLQQTHLERARVLIIALPDPIASRRIIDYARKVNPTLSIAVRTHSGEEQHEMLESGATEAVVGEVELALELVRFTLHRYGVSSVESQAILQRIRARTSRTPAVAPHIADD
jgi:CPA2 family monovalent cation:H+ antiporter-2